MKQLGPVRISRFNSSEGLGLSPNSVIGRATNNQGITSENKRLIGNSDEIDKDNGF
jgi:hypothetical protein